MLRIVSKALDNKELVKLREEIKAVEQKRRNYLDFESKGDSVKRRAAILGIYNNDIAKLNQEHLFILKNILNESDLENEDIELFKNITQSSDKRIYGDFINKDIKQYGLDKVILDKIPTEVMTRELEKLVDEYIPIYTMQKVYNVSTGYLKGKSQNIYSNLCTIINYYKLSITIGTILDSLTQLNISNKDKVLELIEIDNVIVDKMNKYMNTKRCEFQEATKNITDWEEKRKIANKMELEANNHMCKLYYDEYTKRNIPILSDKRMINSMVS